MAYVYEAILRTLEITAEFEGSTSAQVAQGMGQAVQQIMDGVNNALPELLGNQAEIISHDMLRIGPHVIMTFLTRREG